MAGTSVALCMHAIYTCMHVLLASGDAKAGMRIAFNYACMFCLLVRSAIYNYLLHTSVELKVRMHKFKLHTMMIKGTVC